MAADVGGTESLAEPGDRLTTLPPLVESPRESGVERRRNNSGQAARKISGKGAYPRCFSDVIANAGLICVRAKKNAKK
jgi:hypothetical protein